MEPVLRRWSFGVLFCAAALTGQAREFRWTFPVSGAFNDKNNWSSFPYDDFPAAGDFALINAAGGDYTVTCDDAAAGITEIAGSVTLQLDGNFSAGQCSMGTGAVVVRGSGTLSGSPFLFGGSGSDDENFVEVDGAGLTMMGLTTVTSLRVIGRNSAQIKSSGLTGQFGTRPLLESGAVWMHTGTQYGPLCIVKSGALLAADELNFSRAELDAGRLQAAGLLTGRGQAKNGSSISADTASLGDWLLEGGGTGMRVSGSTVPGVIYADISIKSGATFTAGALSDSSWYTVDGSGSTLAVAGGITGEGGPQKVTVLNQGQGSANNLTRTYVLARDPGSLFSFANLAEDSALLVQNGGRINGRKMQGPMTPAKAAGAGIEGAGSALVLSGNLELGSFGPGLLSVSAGGQVECATGVLGGGAVGESNAHSVFGTDSLLSARLGLVVGDRTGLAILNIGDGGRVQIRDRGLAVGGVPTDPASTGSEGRIDVNGGGLPMPSVLDSRQTESNAVGVYGKGLLTVRNRGRILASTIIAGLKAGSDGSIEVIGSGTSLEVDEMLEIGRTGVGRATVFAGGQITAREVSVGSNPGANLLRLTGAGSTLTVSKALHVGNTGIGQLTIQQGASVILTGTFTEPNPSLVGIFDVGANAGATGTVVVDGAGSAMVGTKAFLNVGMLASGNLTVTGGGEVDFDAISITGGQNRSSSATISGAGSVVRAATSLGIGDPFPGPDLNEVTVNTGGLLESRATLAVGRTGVLRLSGGSAVAGQTSETPIPGTAIVANQGLFLLGGRVIGSVVVRQGGTLLPGFSPGQATIEGDVALADGTSLEIELGGTGAGTGYDQINATGTVTLAGHLDIVFRDGFAPTDGQVFEVVRGGTVMGDFSDVNVVGLAPGFSYTLTNPGGNSLLLTATSAGVADSLPALTLTQGPAGFITVSWPGYISGWTLQQSTTLSGGWRNLEAPGNSLTVPALAAREYFRLAKF